MHIISTSNAYVVTDGLTFVKTFLIRAYESRQACFFDAVTTAVLEETVWDHNRRGRIVKKIGVIRERSVGRPHQI
jgi:hypothetical protein